MQNQVVSLMVVLATALSSARAVEDQPKDGIDGDGYLCTWLVCSPLPFKAGEGGAESLGQEQVKAEGTMKPKAGDKIEVGGKSWRGRSARRKTRSSTSTT